MASMYATDNNKITFHVKVEVKSDLPFYKRVWHMIKFPFTYIFYGEFVL